MSSTLHVGRPNIGNRERFLQLANEILDRRWMTNDGPVVQELETRLAEYLGVRHCISVCNATVGLQLACHALGLKGEVITPSFTFVATAHSLQWEGIRPVFCDIDLETHQMDPERVESLITPETSAILGVHIWGRACYPERLEEIASRHNLKLFFDAAHAFGCRHSGKPIAHFGQCEVFSFHATKLFNTFEGGAIATNDDQLAKKLRLMINFGFSGKDQVVHLGTNGKLSEIHAAMGLACLEELPNILDANRSAYQQYRDRLSGLPGIAFHNYDDVERNNCQYVVIEIDEKAAGASRDEVMFALHAEGILARRYFFPGCHRMEPYRSLYPDSSHNLPRTEALCEHILVLPSGSGVDSSDIARVCDSIRSKVPAAQSPEKGA